MPMFLFQYYYIKGVLMFRTYMIKISLLFLLIMILAGCSPKQDIRFNIETHFQKVVSIPLTELETQAMNVYTDFGFYAFEPELCRISKYNNAGEYEFSFGKKGRGPGEFEEGYPISYNAIDNILGIWNFSGNVFSYFDNEGIFINAEVMEFTGTEYFTYTQPKLKIHTFNTIREEIGKFSFVNKIEINEKDILSRKVSENAQKAYDKILYSVNSGVPYIMELSNKKLRVYTYLSDIEELQEIELTGLNLEPDNGICSFISYSDYLIFGEIAGKQHYFNLSGKYLGSNDPEVEQRMFDGAYGEYIYLTNYVDSEMDSIDIYKAK